MKQAVMDKSKLIESLKLRADMLAHGCLYLNHTRQKVRKHERVDKV